MKILSRIIYRVRRWFHKETPEEKRLREYYSAKLLAHQIDTLQLYDPDLKAEIPQNPETIKRIFGSQDS